MKYIKYWTISGSFLRVFTSDKRAKQEIEMVTDNGVKEITRLQAVSAFGADRVKRAEEMAKDWKPYTVKGVKAVQEELGRMCAIDNVTLYAVYKLGCYNIELTLEKPIEHNGVYCATFTAPSYESLNMLRIKAMRALHAKGVI